MIKYYRLNLLIFCAVLIVLGSQCNLKTSSDSIYPTDNIDANEIVDTWHSISDVISRREIVKKIADNRYELIVYRFNSGQVVMELNSSSDPMRLDEWGKKLSADLIINGGYFHEDFSPTGFLAIDGEIIGTKKYAPDKSGLLEIKDGFPSIIDTSSEDFPQITNATSILQSFPLLIKSGGKPGIDEDSNKLARRTVVAQSVDGNFYIIFVDQTPLSLYVLMQLLLDSDLDLDVALNLDGGQSSALMAATKNFSETLLPLTVLPQIISVKSK